MPARRPSPTIALQADVAGRGPVLLLLPTFAGHREAWGVAFTRALAERFTVIAVDWPSGTAGLTVAALAAAVLDLPAPRAARFRLLGWGLGALVGLQLAVTAPRRLARAVLIGATPHGRALHRRYPTVAELCGVAETATPEEHMLGLLARLTSPAWRPFAELFLPQLLPRPADSLAALRAQWQALATFDVCPRLSQIRAPLLLLAGGEDTLTPPHEQLDLAAAIPGAEAHVLAGAGHALVWEQPAAVLAVALPFLERRTHPRARPRSPPLAVPPRVRAGRMGPDTGARESSQGPTPARGRAVRG